MDFESPDVEKDFPGLYASESGKRSNESDFSDDTHERLSKKDLLIGKRKDKKDSKKDRGYATLEGESSAEEDSADIRSPSKVKKSKPFKFPTKKEKREKSREKDGKEKDIEKDKDKKKDCDKDKEKKKEGKIKLKSSKERRKLKHGDENCDIGEEQPIFGVSLSLALERSRCHDGVEIPLVVRDCIIHIEENGLSTEGLYKISGIKSKVQHLRRSYNQRESVNLEDHDLPVVTSLLKLFFRELPESILTNKLLHKFEEASAIRDIATRGVELGLLVKQLPSCNDQLLSWIIKHLVSVTLHEKQNKISAQSLSQIMSNPLQMSQRLLAAFIYHADLLFDNTTLTKYVPPLTSSSSKLPETVDEITQELRKQESLLGQVHSEMNAGFVNKEREELLWEVQRMITQLKRKLKVLEKEAVDVAHQTSTPPQQNQNNITITNSTCEENGKNIPDSNIQIHQCLNNNSSVNISNLDSVNNNGNGGTKHVIEAVIENVNIVEDSMNQIAESDVEDKSDKFTSQLFSSNIKDVNSNNYDSGNVSQTSIDALALRFETEELLSLTAQLQNQIEEEKSNVAQLRLEVKKLGGSPSFCDYLLESCNLRSNGVTGNEKDIAFLKDEQIAGVALFRQVMAETQALQMKKKNLTNCLVEEQQAIIKLKVQMKLLSMNNVNSFNSDPSGTSFIGISGAIGDKDLSPKQFVSDNVQKLSSPVTVSSEDK